MPPSAIIKNKWVIIMSDILYKADGTQLKIHSSFSSVLNGKKYVAFGDSLVDIQSTNTVTKTYSGTDLQGIEHTDEPVRGYLQDIEDRYGVICTAFGDSGGTIIRNYAKAIAQNYTDVVLFTIGFGTNDARTSVTLGEKDSSDFSTYAGALNGILRKVYMDNPECRVLVLTPPQRLTVNDFGSFSPNSNGNTLEDFANMAKEVAQRHSTHCADVFHNSGLNQVTLYFYTREGVHPLNNGYKRYSNLMIPIIDQMLQIESDITGSMVVPSTPASAYSSPVVVALTEDMFTVDATYWNSTDAANSTTEKQVGSGIKLENGKTYLYTFYTTYNALSNRHYAINDSNTTILGSNCWGAADARRGISKYVEEVINGVTYYKWHHAIAVPSTGNYYIWPSRYNALGVESITLKYW